MVEPLQRVDEVVTPPGDALPHRSHGVVPEDPADHRCCIDHPAVVHVEDVEPCLQQAAQGRWDRPRFHVAVDAPPVAHSLHDTGLDHPVDQPSM